MEKGGGWRRVDEGGGWMSSDGGGGWRRVNGGGYKYKHIIKDRSKNNNIHIHSEMKTIATKRNNNICAALWFYPHYSHETYDKRAGHATIHLSPVQNK